MSEEDFARTILEALDDSIPPFVDTLLRAAPRILRDRRRIQAGFEKRLRKRWGKGLDLYRIVLEIAVEAETDFHEEHAPAAEEESDYLFEALTGLHARACLTAFEIHALLRSGCADGAYARWRTLHELAVVSNVLVENGQHNDLAERYLLHEKAEAARDAQAFQKHAATLGDQPLTDQEMEEHDRIRTELVGRFGSAFATPYGWAAILFKPQHAPMFTQLEELAGMSHMRPSYSLSSHSVHAGSRGIALNIKERGPYRVRLVGPSNADLADPGHGALTALTQVTTCLLLRTRPGSIGEQPRRLVISKALLRLTEMAGTAFWDAHDKLEQDEAKVWADPTTKGE